MKRPTTAAILAFVITALIETTLCASIEPGRWSGQQQQQPLNLSAATPQCTTGSGNQNFVQCLYLDANSVDMLEQALADADVFYTGNYEVDIENSDVSSLGNVFSNHRIGNLDLINDGVIPMPFTPLTYLDTTCTGLQISNNNIAKVDRLGGPGSLTAVNMAANQILSITGGAFQSSTLVTLEIYSNNLTSIDATTFTGLPKLQTLSLNKNMIQSIAVNTFSELESIETVNLSTNYLTFLDDGAFNGLEKATLYLDNNPFVCYCSMQWLKDWLQTNGLNETGATCVTPPNTNFDDSNTFCT